MKEIAEDEGFYVVRGIATTPSPDRVGDVVEPMGAKFALPMPLLWQHDSHKPVGHVTFAKPEKSGIPFEAQIPKVKEAGVLKDRIDEAVQSLKYRLVAAVSIGFQSVADKVEMLKTGGMRFLEWHWLELSLVTLPANAEATITSVKSLDQALRAASGASVVHLTPLPGVSGNPNPKGPSMTYAERISAFEAKRAANVARMEAIQTQAGDAGRSKTEQESEEFKNLAAEVKTIDGELVDLRDMEKLAVTKAVTVAGATPDEGSRSRGGVDIRPGAVVTTSPNVEKGIAFARAGMAMIQAKGNRMEAAQIVRANRRWMDQTPHAETFLKTAVPAGDTLTSGYASQLAYAQDAAGEFVEYLMPMTILGKLNPRRVPFNIRYGTQTATSTGNWVGQGLPIPVSKPTYSSGSLGIAKASVLVAIDEELAKLSTPSAEMLVRDDMARVLATFLDVQFVDPNVAASANVSPASITNGVTATAATGTAATNLRTDLATLFTNMNRNELNAGEAVFIMSPETADNIGLMLNSLGLPIYGSINATGGTLLGRRVITSNSANIPGSPASGRMIILVAEKEILLADDGGANIDVSNEASIQLLDNPTNASTGSTVATAMVSMFQTHSIALRCTRFINWAKRRSTAVEYIKEAAYTA